jgi:hypothetical protein
VLLAEISKDEKKKKKKTRISCNCSIEFNGQIDKTGERLQAHESL